MKVNEYRGAPMGTSGEGCQCVCGCWCSCQCTCFGCDPYQESAAMYGGYADWDAYMYTFADVSGSDNNDPA